MVLSGMKRVIRSGGEGPIKGECESPIIKRPGLVCRGRGGDHIRIEPPGDALSASHPTTVVVCDVAPGGFPTAGAGGLAFCLFPATPAVLPHPHNTSTFVSPPPTTPTPSTTPFHPAFIHQSIDSFVFLLCLVLPTSNNPLPPTKCPFNRHLSKSLPFPPFRTISPIVNRRHMSFRFHGQRTIPQ